MITLQFLDQLRPQKMSVINVVHKRRVTDPLRPHWRGDCSSIHLQKNIVIHFVRNRWLWSTSSLLQERTATHLVHKTGSWASSSTREGCDPLHPQGKFTSSTRKDYDSGCQSASELLSRTVHPRTTTDFKIQSHYDHSSVSCRSVPTRWITTTSIISPSLLSLYFCVMCNDVSANGFIQSRLLWRNRRRLFQSSLFTESAFSRR